MNKQALIFLTLFSCILMVSIYYITTPIEQTPLASLTSKSIEEVALLIEETMPVCSYLVPPHPIPMKNKQ